MPRADFSRAYKSSMSWLVSSCCWNRRRSASRCQGERSAVAQTRISVRSGMVNFLVGREKKQKGFISQTIRILQPMVLPGQAVPILQFLELFCLQFLANLRTFQPWLALHARSVPLVLPIV